MSRNAISTDLAPAWPYSPAGPVSSMTRPTVMSQSAAMAGSRRQRRRRAAIAWREDMLLHGCIPLLGFGRLPERPLVHVFTAHRRRRACSGGSLVQIVFHDRAVAAVAVALERVDVAVELVGLRPARASISAWSSCGERELEMARLDGEMGAVARADDDAATRRAPSMAALATVAMSPPCRSAMRASVPAGPGRGPSRRNRR